MLHPEFTRQEALALWSRLVAGWARSLDDSGARTLMDGVPNYADAGGSYEGVTRMLWGLGGWLSRPERPVVVHWRGEAFDTLALTRRALVAGTDPRSPGYWGRAPTRSDYDQRTVESGQVAFALWQTRDRIWAHLSDEERGNIYAWLDRFGQRPHAWRNNWALFWVLNHSGRQALGMPFDQSIIDEGLDYLEGVYCADGWYDDGQTRGADAFDDYNWWVFGTHVLAWAQMDEETTAADGPLTAETSLGRSAVGGRRSTLLERVRLSMQHYPYFFGADGAYTEYGRSLAYKFARLGAPLWAYRAGLWPHSVGMLRRLVGRHMRWYVDRGAVRADGTLRQSLTAEGSVAVREPYIATGSTYWAMLAFGGLWSLADDDPFWTTPEEPLPVEQGDFTRVFPEPGWVVVGTQATGAVQRFNARSHKYPAKYSKFVYSTLAPFNVDTVNGQPAPDAMLCLTDGVQYAHCDGNLAAAVGEPGWLRMRYEQSVGGGVHTIETVIVTRGELHLRAHRVMLVMSDFRSLQDFGSLVPISAVEGPAPLGYSTGETPTIVSNPSVWEWATVADRAVGILALRGYDGQRPASAWQGRDDLNSVYGHYVLPLLTVSRLAPVHELVCLVYIGRPSANLASLIPSDVEATWHTDGRFLLTWDGSILEVSSI